MFKKLFPPKPVADNSINFKGINNSTITISLGESQQTVKIDDLRAMLEEIISNSRQQNSQSQTLTPQQRYDMALQEVAFKHDLQPEELSKAINAWTAAVKADQQASPYDLALAEYKANHFDKAAEQANIAYEQAMQAREQATSEAIKAAHLEGDAYETLANYELALVAYRKAVALLNKAQQPLLWAEKQNKVAQMLFYLAHYRETEPLWQEILTIREQKPGSNHTETACVLNNLAQVMKATNRLNEAEPLMRSALAIDEASFGNNHPHVANRLNNLALLLKATNRLAEAESLMRRALSIDEANGSEYPNVAIRLNNLATLLLDTNRLDEAEPLMRRALAIDGASFGCDHPKIATRLNNLAQLLQATNRLGEAEPLMRRALAIDKASFGSDHPKIAIRLNNLATLLYNTNRLGEAEQLMRRALAIDETNFGRDHPDVARDLNNLAQLLQDTNRMDEAEPLMRQHLLIFLKFTQNTDHQHPHLLKGISNYQNLLTKMQLSQIDINQRLQTLANEAGFSPPQWQALQAQWQGK